MLTPSELGIASVNWKFQFHGHGATVHPQPGTIFVDLGNRLEYGIIDHHHDKTGCRSSTSAIAANSHFVLDHLLGPLNETYYAGRAIERDSLTFVFATHMAPDWDSMTSFYLCDYLVRHASLPSPEVTKAISEATDIIDQGLARIEGRLRRPFLIYLMMMNSNGSYSEWFTRGAALVEYIVSRGGRLTKDHFLEPLSDYADIPSELLTEVAQLEDDHERFEEDIKTSETFKIFVPTRTEVTHEVSVLAFTQPTKSKLQKYWAREECDCGVLVVPFDRENSGSIDRFIVSVDPSGDLMLPVLGRRLELAEAAERNRIGRPRVGPPRFEAEYSDNADPWYDGRGHGYTIVDSPSVGTVLNYDQVIQVIKLTYQQSSFNFHLDAYIDGFISYRRDGGSDLAWAVCNELSYRSKRIFLDVKSLQQGRFDENLLASIRMSKNVIVLLTPGALSRCMDPDDWVRKEILAALAQEKNIIPVIKEGFVFPSDEELPEELKGVFRHNGVTLSHEYFYSSIEKILEFMTV